MNQELFILTGAGALAFYLFQRNRADRKALEEKAIEALGSNSPNIAISNVEGIEERRVLVFKPSSDEFPLFTAYGSQDVKTSLSELMNKGVPQGAGGDPKGMFVRLKSISVVALTKGGNVPLVQGAFYSDDIAMGDMPFASYRVEIRWFMRTYNPYDREADSIQMVHRFMVPDPIWKASFIPRIATVAEQVANGGVVSVPPDFKR